MIDGIDDISISKVMVFMRDNAKPLAKAKADRVYLEQFRKSKKAMLMANYTPTGIERVTDKMRESHAYSHPEYLEVLEGLRVAIEIEVDLMWKMKAAETKAEVWRTIQANNRRVDGVHQ